MPASDPTTALREHAAAMPDAAESLSCNQYAYKVGKKAFFYVGPGAKGVGFKAMFKLDTSMPKALELSEKEPKRVEVGKTGWVTVRFTAERPLAKTVWKKWLQESYALSSGGSKKKAGRAKH